MTMESTNSRFLEVIENVTFSGDVIDFETLEKLNCVRHSKQRDFGYIHVKGGDPFPSELIETLKNSSLYIGVKHQHVVNFSESSYVPLVGTSNGQSLTIYKYRTIKKCLVKGRTVGSYFNDW